MDDIRRFSFRSPLSWYVRLREVSGANIYVDTTRRSIILLLCENGMNTTMFSGESSLENYCKSEAKVCNGEAYYLNPWENYSLDQCIT